MSDIRPEPGDVLEQTRDAGFALLDNILPNELFSKLNAQVKQSWTSGCNWTTRVKRGNTSQVFARQSSANVLRIHGLLKDPAFHADEETFTYLYHSLHEHADESGLVASIRVDLISKLWPTILRIVGPRENHSFSLTAFTPGCYLDPHTDHSDVDVYRLAIILYFGDDLSTNNTHALTFVYRGKVSTVFPRPNRCVVFVPSSETIHSVQAMDQYQGADDCLRLAFSGWLM